MDLVHWLDEQNKKRRSVEWPLELSGIRHAAAMIWVRPLHRDYTDHSVWHSERIIDVLGHVVGELVAADGMGSVEVFILLAAAYLHDIGMQDERFHGGDLDEIRNHHHELTHSCILGKADARVPLGLELVPPEIRLTIADVAEAHRKTDLSDAKYQEVRHGDQQVRARFLAALLRFSDALDIDNRRVHMQLKDLMVLKAEAEFHWLLCYYVSGVSIKNGVITIHYQFPEDCGHYLQLVEPLVRNDVREEFQNVKIILRECGCRIDLDDRCEYRLVPGLAHMPEEALRIAIDRQKRIHTGEIAKYQDRIQYCDSLLLTAFAPAADEGAYE